MPNLNHMLQQAALVRDAKIVGENTANRVGALLVDIVNMLGQTASIDLKPYLPRIEFDDMFEWVTVGTQRYIRAKSTLVADGNLVALYKGDVDVTSYATVEMLGQYATKTELQEALQGLGTGGIDTTELQQYLTTHNYITSTQLPDLSGYVKTIDLPDFSKYALKTEIPSLAGLAEQTWVSENYQPKGNYLTSSALNSYATQTWVNSQGFLKQHQSLADYYKKVAVDTMLTTINSSIASVESALDDKLDALTFDEMFEWVTQTNGVRVIKAKATVVSVGNLVALYKGDDVPTQSVGLDLAALETYLTDNSYVTKDWVLNQGFLTGVTGFLPLSGGEMTGPITMKGSDIKLGTSGPGSDDSGDLVWYYGNGNEKMRIWTDNVFAAATGPNFRVYNVSGGLLYSGKLALASQIPTDYVTSLGVNGNYLTWTKNGTVSQFAVPYSDKSRFLEEATGLARGSYDSSVETPDSLPAGLRVRFKRSTGANSSHTWNSIIDLTAYSGGSSSGAGYRNQFLFVNSENFNDGTFWVRNGVDSTWNAWRQILTDANYSELLDARYYTKAAANLRYHITAITSLLDGFESNIVTFDANNLVGRPSGTTWLNGFISTHKNYLSSIIANEHRSNRWFAGWVESTAASPTVNWVELLHTGNYTTTLDSRYVNKSGDTMTGRLSITTCGRTFSVGSANDGWCHYNTDAPGGHWFDRDVKVQGNIYAGSNYNQLVWHSGNDGSGSGLDADLLDGVHNGELTANMFKNIGNVAYDLNAPTSIMWYDYGSGSVRTNMPSEFLYGSCFTMPTYNSLNGVLSGQFAWDINHGVTSNVTRNLWFRARNTTAWDSWHRIAFVTDNVASATRLQGTYSLWGQNFYGNDVSGDMTGVGKMGFTSAGLELNVTTRGYFFGTTGQQEAAAVCTGSLLVSSAWADQYRVPKNGIYSKGAIKTGDWFYTTGNNGWYNEVHGGGWWMKDSTYIRNYNNKRLLIEGIADYYALEITTGGGICRSLYGGDAWNNGHAALNVGIANNGNQTPLLLAYREYGGSLTGANRLFAMELLNTGTELSYGFGGARKFAMYNNGDFCAEGNVYARGGRIYLTNSVWIEYDAAKDVIRSNKTIVSSGNIVALSKN